MSNKKFEYSYSAREQEEINAIMKKYVPAPYESSSLQKLKMLDRKVTQRATAAGITIGIIGVLVLGYGISCVLVWQDTLFAAGVVIGILGIVITALAHPLYKYILKRERKKAAPEIMRLANELNNSADKEAEDTDK